MKAPSTACLPFIVAVLALALPAVTYADDCNSNGIDDACDIDCGTSGGPCDVEGCGQSEDFNTNGIPDECENHAPVAVCQDVTVDAGSFNCLGVVGPGGVDDGSYDPDGDPLTLTLYPPGPYPLGVTIVSLTVTDDSNLSDTCTATVTVVDTTPPLVACVIGVTIDCDESTDPSNTGQAWATDNCDPAPVLAFTDNVVVPPCPADPAQFVIERTWTGTDSYGNSSSCLSTITVLKLVHSGIIIKQGACPAPLNRNSHGVLPVGLLGTADFDVTTVDPGSVVLSREDCVAGTVAPHEGPPGPHTVVSDVGTPFGGDPCACHELEGDGIDDLSMKFKVDDLVAALGLDSLNAGALVELVVTGTLADGCAFIATDCVRLVPPVSTPGTLIVVSNLDGAWVNTTPVDATQESGGFAGFERSYEPGAVVTLAAEGAAGEGTFHAWEINGAPHAAGTWSYMRARSDAGQPYGPQRFEDEHLIAPPVTARMDALPGDLHWRLVSQVYYRFGYTDEHVPFFDQDHRFMLGGASG